MSLSFVVSKCQSHCVNKSSFSPSVIQPRYICSEINERETVVEGEVFEVPSCVGNELGKDEGKVDRDNGTVVRAL